MTYSVFNIGHTLGARRFIFLWDGVLCRIKPNAGKSFARKRQSSRTLAACWNSRAK
jgi:hypothetical protein